MKKTILALLVISQLLFLQSCEHDQINNTKEAELTEQKKNEQNKIYTFEEQDIPEVFQEISSVSKSGSLAIDGKNDINKLRIDTQNVIGMVDSLGNTTYSLRMTVAGAPRNTLYNVLVFRRADGTKTPLTVLEYVMDDDYFLDRIQGRKKIEGYKRKINYYSLREFWSAVGSTGKSYRGTNPCGTLTYDQNSSPSASSAGGSSSGGGGPKEGGPATGNFNSVGYVTISVPSGNGGGGKQIKGSVEVGNGCFCGRAQQAQKIVRSTSKSGDCLNGEFIVPINDLNPYKITKYLTAKAKCVYKKLMGHTITEPGIMQKTYIAFNDDLNYKEHSLIYNQEKLPKGMAGRTTTLSPIDYRITLNSDMINNRSSIEVAKTLVHESIHALLNKHMRSDGKKSFVVIFSKYVKQTKGVELQHAIMAKEYIAPLADALKKFDGGKESNEYYANLAWDGIPSQFRSPGITDDTIISAIKKARGKGLDCK